MSDTNTTTEAPARKGYAVTWTPHANGHVTCYHWQHATEGMPGWHPTEREARQAAANQMALLADRLVREAYELTNDRHRGR